MYKRSKIKSIFDKTNITQANHSTQVVSGVPVKKTAFDFAKSSKLIAPCDNTVIRYKKNLGLQSEFLIDLPDRDNSQIYVLHALPKRLGVFQEGEVICDAPISHHYHTMIMVNRVWRVLLDYIDRSAELFWYGGKKIPYTNWSHYTDRYLYFESEETEMPVYPQYPIKIKTLNTVPMNLRKEPNKGGGTFGKIVPPGYEWESARLTAGQLVEENGRKTNRWYGVTIDDKYVGWVSGCWVDEIRENPQMEKDMQTIKQISGKY